MSTNSRPSDFVLPASASQAGYLRLARNGELKRRAGAALERLQECRLCPRDCGVDRLNDEMGECDVGRYAKVTSSFPHLGEEECIKGQNGSGAVFFAGCNLKCIFCQNYEISHEAGGLRLAPEYLARTMLELQQKGCHNINLVTPDHVVPQILEALVIAADMGLTIPLIYNSSAYTSPETLQFMEGVVDIYLPDLKCSVPVFARAYLNAIDYPDVACRAMKAMYNQVGDLQMDETGLARHGLLVRHLVLPGDPAEMRSIFHFIATKISIHTYVHIMARYRPAGLVCCDDFDELNRRIRPEEYEQAVHLARESGLYRLDVRFE